MISNAEGLRPSARPMLCHSRVSGNPGVGQAIGSWRTTLSRGCRPTRGVLSQEGYRVSFVPSTLPTPERISHMASKGCPHSCHQGLCHPSSGSGHRYPQVPRPTSGPLVHWVHRQCAPRVRLPCLAWRIRMGQAAPLPAQHGSPDKSLPNPGIRRGTWGSTASFSPYRKNLVRHCSTQPQRRVVNA
jgi:hypothetical protein